jgi:Doubled CXXCH motif (Paired_CXXCH_1)
MKVQLNAIRWVAGASLLMTTQLGVAGTIAGSAHDFTTSAWSGGRICVPCHTTHNSDTTVSAAPLWNHRNSTATYTLYSSPSLKATIGQPSASSKLCMSCHDGTVAVNSFGGVIGTTMISAANNIGTTLNNDHPVGFVYDTALATLNGSLFDPASKTVTIGTGTQIKTGTIAATILYGGALECSSCHDSHNTFTVGGLGTGLLKISAASSAICMACHNK